MNGLGATRISRYTDESTSVGRQDEQIRHAAASRRDTIVYVSTDADVSGAISPFKRPDLGPWLTDPAKIAQWDVIYVAKLDRLTRSLSDLDAFVKWCQANGKTLVSVAESIDLSTAAGRMFAQLLGVFAEFERSRISERRREAAATMRKEARWGGGAIPFGYEPATAAAGHLTLVPKPSEQAVVQRIAQAVIGGTSVTQICKQLNAEGVPSQKGGAWMVSGVLRMLRNPVIRGYVMHRDQVVMDSDGMPVAREGLIDDDTWDRLQEALSRNATGRGANQRAASPLLTGVARCGGCGQPMYARRMKGRDVSYYSCKTVRTGGKCSSASISMADLDAAFSAKMLSVMGSEPRMVPVHIAATDHSRDLATVQERIDAIEDLVTSGEMPPASATRMLTKLEERRSELASLPSSPARIEYVSTGQTIDWYWATLDYQAKRDWLIEQGVTVEVRGYPRKSAVRWELGDIVSPAQS